MAPERVTLLPGALPFEVSVALAPRLRWLRHELRALDKELGIFFPPVQVIPACLMHDLADGTSGHIPGRVNLCPIGEQHVLVVEITAPSLLFDEEDRLRGILAHEFLHVVHYTIAIFQADRDQGAVKEHSHDEYSTSWREYQSLGASTQAAAERWLSRRLRVLTALVEDEDKDPDRAKTVRERVAQGWIATGLPLEDARADWNVRFKVALNPQILDRARSLKLIEA